jgi:nitroreductase
MDGIQSARTSTTTEDCAAAVDEAIASRFSVRRFLPTPVSKQTIDHLLTVASRAPSGTNMQPWKVCVVAGEKKAALEAALVDVSLNGGGEHDSEFPYYPAEFPEPYKSRRRKVGWDLYGLLDITREDKDKMRHQMARNFLFFDAPVGLIFTIDRVLEIGSWLDYGMFMENIMVAARGHGLHTCPQVAFSRYHKIIREHLDIPDEEVVICGMSIGHADHAAPENTLITEREPVEAFTRYFGF